MRAKLIVVGGKADRKQIVLNLPAVVGRSRGAGLTIAHPMVSRQHCEIYESGGLLRIRDLGSTNGVHVAGKRVAEAILRPHDQFSIGPLTFEVDYEYVGDSTVVEEQAYSAPGVSAPPPPETFSAPRESVPDGEGLVKGASGMSGEVAEAIQPEQGGSSSPGPIPESGGERVEKARTTDEPAACAPSGEKQPCLLPQPGHEAQGPSVQPLPTWEAPDDIAGFDLEPSASSEGPRPCEAPSSGFVIAPPDGQIPDFRAWGDRPTTTVGESVPSESYLAGQAAAWEPTSWVPDQGLPSPNGSDSAGDPSDPWPALGFVQEAESQGTRPAPGLSFEDPAASSGSGHAPDAPGKKPTKKRWWLFGKGRSAGTKQDDGPATPGRSPRREEPAGGVCRAGNERSHPQGPLAGSPESPSGPPSEAGAVDPASDGSQSDLDEFFKSLQ